jgi:hypothetical protein
MGIETQNLADLGLPSTCTFVLNNQTLRNPDKVTLMVAFKQGVRVVVKEHKISELGIYSFLPSLSLFSLINREYSKKKESR